MSTLGLEIPLSYSSSHSGAVERPVQNRLQDWVSVLDFIPLAEHTAIAENNSTMDVTPYVQAALDTGKDVYIPNGTYMVDAMPRDQGGSCLRPVSNQKITLESEATLQAITNGLETYYILDIRDVSHVTIEGGTIQGERSTHTGTTGESGMGIAIYNSSYITVRNVVARDCWGDGLYVGGTGIDGVSSQVVIDNAKGINNRRQGLTIASVDGCRVIGGEFTGTSGIPPECGIDIEGNYSGTAPKGRLRDIVIDGVRCTDNAGHGIAASQWHTTDLTIENAYCVGNSMCGLDLAALGRRVRVIGGTFNENVESGISIKGSPTEVSTDWSVENADCHNNTLDGITVGLNIRYWSIKDNRVSHNGRHGINLDGTLGSYTYDGHITGNHIWNNSQATDLAADNLYLGNACVNIILAENWARANVHTQINANTDPAVGGNITPANRPRYGFNIDKDTINYVFNNDLQSAGITANMVIKANTQARGNLGFKTERRVLSPSFLVDAAASVTVTIPHGCSYTPSVHHCQLSVVDAAATGFAGTAKIQQVDATNVTARVTITTAAAIAGATANLALAVERPLSV